MITMNDEIFDRAYQNGRADLNAGLDRLVRRIVSTAGNAFHVLRRIEFDAPWKHSHRRARRA
jgi:hypothetical protein